MGYTNRDKSPQASPKLRAAVLKVVDNQPRNWLDLWSYFGFESVLAGPQSAKFEMKVWKL